MLILSVANVLLLDALRHQVIRTNGGILNGKFVLIEDLLRVDICT
jgi:hypothetical protein